MDICFLTDFVIDFIFFLQIFIIKIVKKIVKPKLLKKQVVVAHWQIGFHNRYELLIFGKKRIFVYYFFSKTKLKIKKTLQKA